MTVWIPKLTPRHPKPCSFFHVGNKNSTCYFRTTPLVLADTLEQVTMTLRSDSWLDKWERINQNSEGLLIDNLFLDEDYFDMPLFEKNLEI
jgi:hypothetical protein